MNQGRTVFAQLMDELPKHAFDKCVHRYAGNKHVRTLPTYEHFLDGIKKAKAVYKEAKKGDTLKLGSLSFAVLSADTSFSPTF